MEIVRKIIDGKKETSIKHSWDGPAADAKVIINDGVGEGNASCHFLLEINGGQVTFNTTKYGGSLEMFGEWERECFLKLLKQIVTELELIEKQ
jgi:hypothetical protein